MLHTRIFDKYVSFRLTILVDWGSEIDVVVIEKEIPKNLHQPNLLIISFHRRALHFLEYAIVCIFFVLI
jgi:hypothetical protein